MNSRLFLFATAAALTQYSPTTLVDSTRRRNGFSLDPLPPPPDVAADDEELPPTPPATSGMTVAATHSSVVATTEQLFSFRMVVALREVCAAESMLSRLSQNCAEDLASKKKKRAGLIRLQFNY